MQHLKEFLIRLQTFNLRITMQEFTVHKNLNTTETRRCDGYDITRETGYYDSFSYKSELRVCKDMALIDLLILDDERLKLELEQVRKVVSRFKELWNNWHEHHNEWLQDYQDGYLFTIGLDRLFIVNGLRGSNANVAVPGQFVEDLGDSMKVRERFLKELVNDVEKRLAPPKPSQEEFIDALKLTKTETNEANALITDVAETHSPTLDFPTFDPKAAELFYGILKNYFDIDEHTKLEALLIKNQIPQSPLTFRGQANQLADAFKQLHDERLIITRRMMDLEKWLTLRFNYLNNQGQIRGLSEDYLSGIMSEKTRPCKSPILKVERKQDYFFILPVSRGKK